MFVIRSVYLSARLSVGLACFLGVSLVVDTLLSRLALRVVEIFSLAGGAGGLLIRVWVGLVRWATTPVRFVCFA